MGKNDRIHNYHSDKVLQILQPIEIRNENGENGEVAYMLWEKSLHDFNEWTTPSSQKVTEDTGTMSFVYPLTS